MHQYVRRYLTSSLLVVLAANPVLAQEHTVPPIHPDVANSAAVPAGQQPSTAPTGKRSITVSDAVAIFLQQNLDLVAARYDVDTADAEKLTAQLRPN
ncbi:MAG TPA: hypothetical protein PLF26_20090, partial [Blastocatellia bacterium]|nr:hypothetical protein [Blastocatellia bacterium]